MTGGAAVGVPEAAAALLTGARTCRRSDDVIEDAAERADRLRHAVFEHLEIRLREIADRRAFPVAYHDIHEHRPHAFVDRAGGALRRRRLLRVAGQDAHTQEDDDGSCCPYATLSHSAPHLPSAAGGHTIICGKCGPPPRIPRPAGPDQNHRVPRTAARDPRTVRVFRGPICRRSTAPRERCDLASRSSLVNSSRSRVASSMRPAR